MEKQVWHPHENISPQQMQLCNAHSSIQRAEKHHVAREQEHDQHQLLQVEIGRMWLQQHA